MELGAEFVPQPVQLDVYFWNKILPEIDEEDTNYWVDKVTEWGYGTAELLTELSAGDLDDGITESLLPYTDYWLEQCKDVYGNSMMQTVLEMSANVITHVDSSNDAVCRRDEVLTQYIYVYINYYLDDTESYMTEDEVHQVLRLYDLIKNKEDVNREVKDFLRQQA